MVKQYWNELSPQHKKYATLVVSVVGLLLFVSIFASSPQSTSNRGPKNNVKTLLINQDTREFGIDNLAAKGKRQDKKLADLQRKLENTQQELRKLARAQGRDESVEKDLQELMLALKESQDKTLALSDKVEMLMTKGVTPAKSAPETEPVNPDSEIDKADTDSTLGSSEEVNQIKTGKMPGSEYFAKVPTPEASGDKRRTKNDAKKSGSGIRVVSEHPQEEEDAEVQAPEDDSVYLPAGAIITGVLINGMDAPTSIGARKEPSPSLMRIQKEAILPNRFTADIRECFGIVGGFGDLSSERAYLRGEAISCVRDDGSVVEARLEGYAVGEDGKTGVRGRLVSKQGQLIARSMVAGFMEGVSGAFENNPVPVIQTSGVSNDQIFQDAFSKETAQNSFIGGSGKALERISEYYLELAENIFPIIEVDAGREIDFVLVRGVKLQFKGKK